MNAETNHRSAGRAVGILYILGTLSGIVSAAALAPVSQADAALDGMRQHPNAIPIAAFAVLVMGISLALIPIVAYPILRAHSALLARGYVVFRSGLESATYLMMVAGWLLLVPLVGNSVSGADASVAPFAEVLVAGQGVANVGAVVFVLGAAMFYVVLWRARLVPRWVSGWGLAALVPYLVAAALGIAGALAADSQVSVALDVPLAIQEMVLAVWLIVRGFRPSTSSEL